MRAFSLNRVRGCDRVDERVKVKVLVTRLCLTLGDPMKCSPSGSPAHGILQARTLEWVAIPFSWGSSPPRGRTPVSLQADSLLSEPPGRPKPKCCENPKAET